MNKVILIGNLAKDPETRTTTSGKSVSTLTVAVNRRFKDADGNRQADFINVICWNQLSDLCSKYLAKGRKVGVTGALQTREYKAQDGSKRYVTEVLADEIEFLSQAQNGNAPAPTSVPANEMIPDYDEEMPF